MQYSDTTNYTGIIQEEERLVGLGYAGISGVTANLKEFTSLNNIFNSEIWHLIFTSNGNWQYDDSNKTDLPSATTDLVSGTAKYALPTEALTVKRIEVKDQNGEWTRLTPMSLEEVGTIGEYLTDAGVPRFYRLIGNTVEVYPTPNYNSTGGFKPFFDRSNADFATTDTTKTPGFAAPYHRLLPIKTALAWLKVHTPQSAQIPLLLQDEAKCEKELKEFYGKRFKDKQPKVGRVYQSFK